VIITDEHLCADETTVPVTDVRVERLAAGRSLSAIAAAAAQTPGVMVPTPSAVGGVAGGAVSSKPAVHRVPLDEEARRRKLQKKKLRLQEKEEELNTVKSSWQSFAAGKLKKSIFSTPDSVHGRVGIGTCGIGGRAMTECKEKRENWRSALPRTGESGET
jgi:hypothetical protein